MRWYHATLIPVAGLLATMDPAYAQGVRSAAPQDAAAATSASNRRDDWQRPADIFDALGATAGSRIADLGAGEGWLTLRLAKRVGPTGRVFASDISGESLGRLQESLGRDSLHNVELLLAEDDDPRLPFGTLDGVVILNAYHEMHQRVAVLDGVTRALRPGGVLVIVDNVPADSTARSRKEQTARHSLALEFVRDDLEAQGFEIVTEDPAFVDQRNGAMQHRQWMIVARRPKK